MKPIIPGEEPRAWFSLVGTVTGSTTQDKRNFLRKKRHYFLTITFDEDSYERAGDKTQYETCTRGTQEIPREVRIEISHREFIQYASGDPIEISFGISSLFDQEEFLATPIQWVVRQPETLSLPPQNTSARFAQQDFSLQVM